MQQDASPVELLKNILSQIKSPAALNNHDWAVLAQVDGATLVSMLVDVFRRMMPSSSPRVGKRLDTRWGAFGILAAQYFAPTLKNIPAPTSLRDAWNSMDDSILFFIYGEEDVSEEKKTPYRLTEGEREPAPNSTLSDWHRRGVEQLATLMQAECETKRPAEKARGIPKSWIKTAALVASLLLLSAIAFLGWEGWTLYRQARQVEAKAQALQQSIQPNVDMKNMPDIARQSHELRVELDALSAEATPYLWLAKYAEWIPRYGGTLAQAEDLLSFSQNLGVAADEGLSAVSPLIETALKEDRPVEVLDLVMRLNEASPQLLSAQIALARAEEARARLDTTRMLPRLADIITGKIDPLLGSLRGDFPMEDALTLVRAAPELMGGGKAGPQTYLILMQNEDELRPTGGFLTAVGLAVVKDAKLLNIKINSSDKLDAFFEKPYPTPPWQFREFMNIHMFALRDANWFTDFPTTASWAEYFYSYTQGASADGVITLDMRVIQDLLKVTGAVRVNGVNTPITGENALEYLRSAEKYPPKGVDKNNWDRKQFIADLAEPLMEKILAARGKTWSELAPVLISLLDEKHILLQFDHEEMTALLERRNWDGAVRIPDDSDFLMVVDTNMGYNKSNAVMEMSLDYAIDLSGSQPTGSLKVTQTNHASAEIPCEPFAIDRFIPQEKKPGQIPDPVYNIEECHWGYLRAYLPQGAELTYANPQEISDTSTWLGQTIPARTDDLKDEDIPNAQVYGMMTLTATRSSLSSLFEYNLPARVLSYDKSSGLYIYRLKIQKQPGSLARPIQIDLRLPLDAVIAQSNLPLENQNGEWQAKADLKTDLWLEVEYNLP